MHNKIVAAPEFLPAGTVPSQVKIVPPQRSLAVQETPDIKNDLTETFASLANVVRRPMAMALVGAAFGSVFIAIEIVLSLLGQSSLLPLIIYSAPVVLGSVFLASGIVVKKLLEHLTSQQEFFNQQQQKMHAEFSRVQQEKYTTIVSFTESWRKAYRHFIENDHTVTISRQMMGSVQSITASLQEISSVQTANREHMERISEKLKMLNVSAMRLAELERKLNDNLALINKIQNDDSVVAKILVTRFQKSLLQINTIIESANKVGEVLTSLETTEEVMHILSINTAIKAANTAATGSGVFAQVAKEMRQLKETNLENITKAKQIISKVLEQTNLINERSQELHDSEKTLEHNRSQQQESYKTMLAITATSIEVIDSVETDLKNLTDQVLETIQSFLRQDPVFKKIQATIEELIAIIALNDQEVQLAQKQAKDLMANIDAAEIHFNEAEKQTE